MDKSQVLMLVKTASVSNSSPADLLGFDDPDVAFAFNVQCAEVQNEWEMEREFEREKRQLELLSGQSISSALGGEPQQGSHRVIQG